MTFEIGDKIKDEEDEDCYYIGIWQGEGKYKVTEIIWCGDLINESPINEIIEPKWWIQTKIN
jgi:hypothetical protein